MRINQHYSLAQRERNGEQGAPHGVGTAGRDWEIPKERVMKRTLLASVAALALAAGSTVALSQGSGGGGGASGGGAGGGAGGNTPSATSPSGGQDTSSPSTPGTKGAQERT